MIGTGPSPGMYRLSRPRPRRPGVDRRRVPEAVERLDQATRRRERRGPGPCAGPAVRSTTTQRRPAGPRATRANASPPRRAVRDSTRAPRRSRLSHRVPAIRAGKRDVGQDVVRGPVHEVAEQDDAVGGGSAERDQRGPLPVDEVAAAPNQKDERGRGGQVRRADGQTRRPVGEVVRDVADLAEQELVQVGEVLAPVGELAGDSQGGGGEQNVSSHAGGRGDSARSHQRARRPWPGSAQARKHAIAPNVAAV